MCCANAAGSSLRATDTGHQEAMTADTRGRAPNAFLAVALRSGPRETKQDSIIILIAKKNRKCKEFVNWNNPKRFEPFLDISCIFNLSSIRPWFGRFKYVDRSQALRRNRYNTGLIERVFKIFHLQKIQQKLAHRINKETDGYRTSVLEY